MQWCTHCGRSPLKTCQTLTSDFGSLFIRQAKSPTLTQSSFDRTLNSLLFVKMKYHRLQSNEPLISEGLSHDKVHGQFSKWLRQLSDLLHNRPARPDEMPSTSKSELIGWICYDFASAVYPNVVSQVLFPLILVQMSRAAGRVVGTENTPCNDSGFVNTTNSWMTSELSPNTVNTWNQVNATGYTDNPADGPACEVEFFGAWIPSVSLVLYTSSITTILQMLTFLSIGALADYGRLRKLLFASCSIVGSIICLAYPAIMNEHQYGWIVAFYIIGNVMYGCTVVFYNAYLPVLVHNHPFIRGKVEDLVDMDHFDQHLTLFGIRRGVRKLRSKVEQSWANLALRLFSFTRWRQSVRCSGSSPNTAADADCVSSRDGDEDYIDGIEYHQREREFGILTLPINQPSDVQYNKRCVYDKETLTLPIGDEIDFDTNSQSMETVSEKMIATESRLSDRLCNVLSTHGLASGQVASLTMILVSVAVLKAMSAYDSSAYPMRICVALCGIWWFLWSNITWLNLKTRPGKPLPTSAKNLVWFSWKQTLTAVRHYKKLPNTFLYLVCYLLFADSFTTLGQIAILFASDVIKMTSEQIAVAIILAAIAALFGSYFWLGISRRFQWSTKRSLVTVLCVAMVLPSYGLLGFIPSDAYVVLIDSQPPLTLSFGLRSPMEMYVGVVLMGSLLGAIQSFGRVQFSDLVPRNHEAEFFALYEIGDRGSSWLGPLIVGAIANASSGEVRYGFIYVIAMLLISVLLMVGALDVSKGRQECRQFVNEEQQQTLLQSYEQAPFCDLEET
ncbi:hypothetical protein MP228_000871 [Amoeboaphelidium protococcarum]|nr:hypothetical protein MP228_000871 [Amoeboaphelidium protococcarum]